jgi:hypothetical protein
MSKLNAKTTIYLDPSVKKFLKHKAVTESSSLSEIINGQFEDMLEDLDDLNEIKKRRNEETVPFETVLKELGLTSEHLQS